MSEHERRPALRFNRELAEQFGINPDIPDPPRETVKVDRIPDLPEVHAQETARPTQAHLNLEEVAIQILKEEYAELAIRLERFGIPLTPAQQQDLLDYTMALASGFISGGARGRR